MKFLFTLVCLASVALAIPSNGQFSGNDSPAPNSSEYYTYFLDVYTTSPHFSVSGGTIVSESHSGLNHDLTVTWGSVGSGSITFYDGGSPYDTYYVTITCPTVSNPSTTFSYTQNCGNTVITRNANPPSGVTWYWQTSSSGTSTSYSGNTYTVISGGIYYLRAQSTAYSTCWSSGSASTSSVTVNIVPGGVTSPTGASRCGTGTVTLSASTGTSGSGVKWYTASSGGTLVYTGNSFVTSSLSATTTYYACTYISSTGCESARTAITATINALPSSASSVSASPSALYGPGTTVLSATGAGTGETYSWYYENGSSFGSTTVYLTATTSYYVAKRISATGCESATRISVNVPVYSVPSITPSTTQYIAYGSSASLSATAGFYSYQWLRNDTVITGATAQTHAAIRTGVYKVQVKGSSTAPVYTTSSVTVSGPMSQVLNMVSTTQIHKEGLTLNSVLDTLSRDKLTQVISYMDGMGRTFQTLAVAASPDQFDLVSATLPEKQGLAMTSFLPYVSDAKDGRYRPYALRNAQDKYARVGQTGGSEQYEFYQNTSQVAHDTKPYSKTVYRLTPDARAIESGAPGNHWQPVSGDTTHTVRSVISFNATSDSVRKWNSAGASSGYYAANTVVVETTKDENNNQVISYTNALGQLVLKKVQYETSKWLKTYYIYDDYGRLKFQVPPRAVGLFDSTPDLVGDTNLEGLIYTYTYDNKSRLIAKKVPGALEESIVYDKLDRVVLTQDGNLKSMNKWMFIKYDFYGRPVYSGLFSSSSSRSTLQTALDTEDYTQSGVKWYEYEVSGTNDYSNQAYPRTNTTVLTINYYDHYDFNRNGTADYSFDGAHLTGQETTALTSVRGSATGTRKQTVDAAGNATGTWLTSVIFYGAYDRVIQTLSNNHLYATLADKTTIIYNFAGQVVKSKTTHTSSATFSVSYVDRPVYDHAGRVRKQYRNIDNSTNDQLVAEYLYNKLGQVVDKKLHYSSGAYLQSVDYRYNIRGWLTSINNAQLTSDGTLNDDTGDYFGMELAYEKVISGMSNAKQSNGNISAMKWRTYGTTGAAGQRSYKYAYDFSDRLTAATFQASSAATTWDKEVNTLNETLTYDANGNIKTLVRKRNDRGLQAGTPPVITSSAQTIDDLTYIYQGINGGAQNSNVLVRVNEAVSGTTGQDGFKNGADSDTEFIYQTWGSLKKDANKGIDSIAYNFLGKPKKVYFNTGRVVEYTYDAGGNKLSVKTVNGATTESFSNYVGSFVYEGTTPALSFFSSPEGRVVKNGSNYEYQYAISDHQGNTRIIFSSVTPSTLNLTATFEGDANDNSGSFVNVNGANVLSFTAANHTASGAKVVRMNQNYAAGPSKSIKVYPGDKIDAEVWTYYEANSGYGTGSPGVAAMVTAIATGFGGVSGGGGESGSIYNGVNSALGGFGLGGNAGNTAPAAYLNYILFDQQYKVLDMGWVRVPTSAYFSKQKINLAQVAVKEAGYVFVYLSYEDQSNNYVYFDDFKVTHTKSNLIQGNEYYPFGMQTGNSWTRENVTGNRFLANGGTELNTTTQLYDLDFRNYDPALGRMYGVDPMAAKYASLTPYNYSFNNPTSFSDASGADPNETVNYSAMNGQYYSAYTYDDKIESRQTAVWYDAMGWRNEVPGAAQQYGWATGTGGSMGRYWHPGDGRMFWSGYESVDREIRFQIDALRFGDISRDQFARQNYVNVKPEHYSAFATVFNSQKNDIHTAIEGGSPSGEGGQIDPTDENLNNFVKDNFSSSYKKYDESWMVNSDKTKGKYATTLREKGKINVYVNPGAFASFETLYLVVGHELVHVYLIGSGQMDRWAKSYRGGMDMAQKISEFYAYSWQAQTAAANGWADIRDGSGRTSSDRVLLMFEPKNTELYIPWEHLYPLLMDVNRNNFYWNK